MKNIIARGGSSLLRFYWNRISLDDNNKDLKELNYQIERSLYALSEIKI